MRTGILRSFTLSTGRGRRLSMPEPCYKERDSSPPMCGVHKVPLLEAEAAIDILAPYLGRITFLKCPVSQSVVLDSEVNRPGDSA